MISRLRELWAAAEPAFGALRAAADSHQRACE
jgi:hypothetical protein